MEVIRDDVPNADLLRRAAGIAEADADQPTIQQLAAYEHAVEVFGTGCLARDAQVICGGCRSMTFVMPEGTACMRKRLNDIMAGNE